MKKEYIAPDLELIEYRLHKDILVVSPTEETIPEIIVGGGEGGELEGGLD